MQKAIIKKAVVGALETNCYIFACEKTREAAIIDPGFDCEKISNIIKKLDLKLKYIINTHGHIDHIGCNSYFTVPVMIHKQDRLFLIDPQKNLSGLFGTSFKAKNSVILLSDNDIIKIGNIELKVLHTPGHTPGSICLQGDDIVFTGDTLFFQGIGRTDLPDGSDLDIINSIKTKLLSLPDYMIIYPGHGPDSTIKKEKDNNPYA